jgi:hypothetical protein
MRVSHLGTVGVVLAAALALSGAHPRAADDRRPQAGGAGAGVTIKGRITRDTFKFSGTDMPAWQIELEYTNNSSAPVEFGDALILMAPDSTRPLVSGVHVTRDSSDRTRKDSETMLRYRLDWGLHVPADGTGSWNFMSLTGSQRSANALIETLLMKAIDPLPGGGFGPPLEPGGTRVIRERVLFPFDNEILGRRDKIVVVPPGVRAQGAAASLPPRLLVFPMSGAATAGQSWDRPEIETAASASELSRVALDSDQALWRRVVAVNWLAETFSTQAAAPLTQLAGNTAQHLDVRVAAILNAGYWQIADAGDLLVKTIGTEAAGPIRNASLWALGRLGHASAAPAVLPLVEDKDETTASFALTALGRLHADSAIPAITACLASGKRPGLHAAAAEALVAIGTESGRTTTLAVVQNPKARDDAREAVIDAIGEAQSAWATRDLVALLADPKAKESLQIAAIRALSRIGGAEAAAAIRAATNSERKRVREAAEAAQKRLGQAR